MQNVEHKSAKLTMPNGRTLDIDYPVLKRIIECTNDVVYVNRDKSKKMSSIDTKVLSILICIEVMDPSIAKE